MIHDNANPPRVLVVEDNPFNRELMEKILDAQGFGVDSAKNGKEAIDRVRSEDFRLIFMDLLMPGMDGFDTIRRIRQMGVSTPIIAVSSMNSKQDRQRCLEAGGDDFLPKPIDVARLNRLVAKHSHPEPRPAQDAPSPPAEAQTVSFADYPALLVEEDPETARRFAAILSDRGMEVTAVARGDQAWEAFTGRPGHFRIIVSNAFTSGVDGLGLLARVKREHAHALVFIYAGEPDPDTFQLAVQLGADGVLAAADFPEEIAEAMETAIYQAAQRGSRTQAASTVSQVRRAQASLIKYGCHPPCEFIDIAYSQLTDAGGDLACCRRFNLAGRCGVFIGDVSGHSVMSSYLSAFYLGVLTSNWNRAQNPMALLKVVNQELTQSDYSEYHLCATALLWDRLRHRVDIATAGNPGPLLVLPGENGPTLAGLRGGGMCLGLLPGEDLFLSQQLSFPEGARLLAFTDGIKRPRIEALLRRDPAPLRKGSVSGLGQRIIDRILETEGQRDDMLLVTLHSPPDEGGAAPRRSFASNYAEVDAACRWAEAHLTAHALPPGKDPALALLALREALINAVSHGNGFDPAAMIDLRICADPKGVRIEVSDEGPGFEPPRPIARIDQVDPLQTGGRGLSVMRSVADAVTVAGGTVSLIFGNPTLGEHK